MIYTLTSCGSISPLSVHQPHMVAHQITYSPYGTESNGYRKRTLCHCHDPAACICPASLWSPETRFDTADHHHRPKKQHHSVRMIRLIRRWPMLTMVTTDDDAVVGMWPPCRAAVHWDSRFRMAQLAVPPHPRPPWSDRRRRSARNNERSRWSPSGWLPTAWWLCTGNILQFR